MAYIEGRIIIGKYVIEERDNNSVWIYLLDGEGGEFSSEALEKVIDSFYEDNF